MSTPKVKLSPRERLLASADQLFYSEGINAVGIDRILEHAGVAKASLYSVFGSKEELVRAYLEERSQTRRATIMARLAEKHTPRSKLLALFEQLSELVASPTFRGCPFINASAERRTGGANSTDPCADHRNWRRRLFTDLAREAGAAAPSKLGNRLALLYDGALIAAAIDGDREAPTEARAVAELLLEGAVGKRRERA